MLFGLALSSKILLLKALLFHSNPAQYWRRWLSLESSCQFISWHKFIMKYLAEPFTDGPLRPTDFSQSFRNYEHACVGRQGFFHEIPWKYAALGHIQHSFATSPPVYSQTRHSPSMFWCRMPLCNSPNRLQGPLLNDMTQSKLTDFASPTRKVSAILTFDHLGVYSTLAVAKYL